MRLVQVSEYGENSTVACVLAPEVHLGQDAMDVLLNGALGEEECLADPEIGSTLGHEYKHLSFSGGKRMQRVTSTAG